MTIPQVMQGIYLTGHGGFEKLEFSADIPVPTPKAGGRYVASGAIAGPIVELDVRTLYLKDLSLLGSTYQSDVVFENLIGYIERGEICPVVAKTYPLKNIVEAQTDFLAKKHTGKLVLIPE